MVDVLAAGSVFCIYQRIKIECLHSMINRDAARDENGGGLWWAKGEGG